MPARRRSLQALAALLMVPAAFLVGQQPSVGSSGAFCPSTGGGPTAACVNGVAIPIEALMSAAGNRLLRYDTERYNALRVILDQYIDDQLLVLEAQRRGTGKDSLLRQLVDAQIAPVQEAEVEAVYSAEAGRYRALSRAAAFDTIRAMLESQRRETRRRALLSRLRSEASIELTLPPPRFSGPVPTGSSQGRDDASITIVEYSDFECPFCRRASELLKEAMAAHPEKIRRVFQSFPLSPNGNGSVAAEAAFCAEEQGKFWDMYEELFAQANVGDAGIRKSVHAVGLDEGQFSSCQQSQRYRDRWRREREFGKLIGVNSTPTLLINGRLVLGAPSRSELESIINEELRMAK